jgi:transcriptional regulator with XRE-family HTH domain
MTFGDKVKKLRKGKGFSQQELAKLVGVHYSHIGRYERGDSEPSIATVKKIAEVFGVSTDYLLFDEGEGVASSKIPDKELREQFEAASKLSESEKQIIKEMLDAVLIKHQLGKMVKKENQ